MNSELMIFEGHNVEVLEWEDRILFNPKHVAECLDIKNVNDNITRMSNKQVIKLKNSDIGLTDFRKLNNAGESFLTESGVYKLIFKSHKEEAEKFQDWVTDDVLPTIRKHGAYMTEDVIEEALTNPDFLIRLATELKDEKLKRKEAERKIEESKPLVSFAETCIKSKDNILVRQLSKIANDEGIDIGEKRLFSKLREWNLIMSRSTEPYQYGMDREWFVVEEKNIDTSYGIKLTRTTKVTPKGQVYIIERLKKEVKN